MTEHDYVYIAGLADSGVLKGPVLELGAGYGGKTCREIFTSRGISYFGTDIVPGENVDFVVNFENAGDLEILRSAGPYSSVLVLNVLEHVFDPIKILDNALSLVKAEGCLAALTPAIWPLHSYPNDVWRIMPDFYEQYASRRKLKLLYDHFEYVGKGPVNKFCDADFHYQYPAPCDNKRYHLYGRVIHKIFNTFGRGMVQPSHLAVAAVLVKSNQR